MQQRDQALMCTTVITPSSVLLPGLQDVTAHVDFTAMAVAALVWAGCWAMAARRFPAGRPDRIIAANAAENALAYLPKPMQKLVSPAEMGRLFKVLAVGINVVPARCQPTAATAFEYNMMSCMIRWMLVILSPSLYFPARCPGWRNSASALPGDLQFTCSAKILLAVCLQSCCDSAVPAGRVL